MEVDIKIILENESLKKEFAYRNLNLSDVFYYTPDDLERENAVLKNLLDWVRKYSECKSRKIMESEGYEFPPIEPDFDPDNDWYIFERWINGLPVRMQYKDKLPKSFVVKNPNEIGDEEICLELQKLIDAFEEAGSCISLNEGVPARLVYEFLLETMGDESEFLISGGWTIDGCTGSCPDCFQRPWCDGGGRNCWNEDIEAGEMFLIDPVKKYVSASPISLKILQLNQAEEDKKFKKFQDENNNIKNPYESRADFLNNDDDLPF